MKVNFWLQNYPFATRGLLKSLKTKLGSNLKIFVMNQIDNDRSQLNQKSMDLPTIYIEKSVAYTIQKNKIDLNDSINIVNGFYSFSLSYLIEKKNEKNLKILNFCEIPAPMGKFKSLKRIAQKMKYKKLAKRFSKNIDGYVAIGQDAEEYYRKISCGLPVMKTYYIPDIDENVFCSKLKQNTNYLYIGRNDFINKGLDKLLKYFSKNKQKNLYIIGDYGNNSDDVKKYAKKYKNIILLGKKSINETINFLSLGIVKCVLVPSNADGWNVNPYMALMSAIPCITTKSSGSSDIVNLCNHGLICKSNSSYSYSKTISKFDSLNADYFCENAKNNRNKFLSVFVAENLINSLKETYEK